MSGIRAEVAKLVEAATAAADRDRRGRAPSTSSFDHEAYAALWRKCWRDGPQAPDVTLEHFRAILGKTSWR